MVVETEMTMRDINIWWAIVISSGLIGSFIHHIIFGLVIGIFIASHVTIITLWVSEKGKGNKHEILL
jgi:hypothetical protein